nr:hypothetical protein [uncultured Draconibacterium sp.]
MIIKDLPFAAKFKFPNGNKVYSYHGVYPPAYNEYFERAAYIDLDTGKRYFTDLYKSVVRI